MHGEELYRRHAPRLVQPFDVGDDVAFRLAVIAGSSSRPVNQLALNFTASRRTPLQRTRARAGDCAAAAVDDNNSTPPPRDPSKEVSSLASSPEVLPPFFTRTRGAGGATAAPPAPSVSSSQAHCSGGREAPPASSSVQSVSSSVDRLAALYRQFQISQGSGSNAPGRSTAGELNEAVTPTPAKKGEPTAPVHLSRLAPREGASGGSGTASEETSHGMPAGGSSLAPAKSSQPASKGDQLHVVQPREDAVRVAAGGSSKRSTPAPLRDTRTASAKMSTSSQHGAAAPLLSSRSQPARATVALPPSLSCAGIPALMDIAVRVWAALGFFEMRPIEGVLPDEEGEAVGVSHCATGPSSPEDVESFLCGLLEYLSFFHADSPGPSAAVLTDFTVLLRNGLWRVLFNAIFYCLTALDRRRRRRSPLSRREVEVCTGGAEDAYEMVYSSTSSDADEEDGNEVSVSRKAPVRLVWKHPSESDEECLARCVRDTLPPNSPLWYVLPSTSGDRGADSASMAPSDHRGGIHSLSSRYQLDDVYGGRLRAALPIAEWHFVLRCLAQVGYQRDAFYLQTPFHASPQELLLALLWLTQQYKLLAVVEYVELNRRYPFLLQYHMSDAFLYGSVSARGAPRPSYATARERLLYRLSCASAWPPVSFDENATISARFAQLERCLGKSTSPGPPGPPSAPTGHSAATLHVRRLMAVRRLLGLSFNRLHQALQRQAEQVTYLGLHSPLDAQLCRKEHHALYEEATAGFAYVQATSQRLRTMTEHLAKAGSLVAFLLRYEESTVSAEEVLLALEEDEATWLSRSEPTEGDTSGTGTTLVNERHTAAEAHRWRRAVRRGALPISHSAPEGPSAPVSTSAALLAQALSTLRGTRVRATLTDMWRRLLRRSHVAPQTVQPESLRFLLDVEAQQVQETRVRENMKNRYSMQAALAAELAVLAYHNEQRCLYSHQSRTSPRAGDGSALRAANSTADARVAEDSRNVGVRPVQVDLPPLDLVTSTSIALAQLRSEEAIYGSVTLGSAELQLTEVGEPAAGSTTSARLELERLQLLEEQLDTQLRVPAQTAARSEYCKGLLEALHHQYGLRMAMPLAQVGGRTHRSAPGERPVKVYSASEGVV
ncbi:hypothetical protein JKF63_05054 [Porcisia hertigi]|uniref:Uncharacterized protein n=1 Tax=Porcisia hertigi TaxID=2761500 RepID=A0A836IA78_9TRYP|nr:hypothetical protein JKF63_05054 [Porcisia hertigi]